MRTSPEAPPHRRTAHLDEHVQDELRLPCACLFGICGRCSMGDCRRCANRSRPAAWYGSCETWLLRRDGTAIEQAPVWLADRTCRYRCPCRTCWAAERAPRPAEQLDLFAEAM